MPNLVDLLIYTISQYPGLRSLLLHPLVRGLSQSLTMKVLSFTVAEQRRIYIGLPCKEDICDILTQLLIICANKSNDYFLVVKQHFSSAYITCYYSVIDNSYYLEFTTPVMFCQVQSENILYKFTVSLCDIKSNNSQ